MLIPGDLDWAKMLTSYGSPGLAGGRGPEPIPEFLELRYRRAAWSMTPASHSSKETAGNPGSNPGGRTTFTPSNSSDCSFGSHL